MKRKVLSVLLIVAMLVSVMPFTVQAAAMTYPSEMDGVYAMNPEDNNTLTHYNPNYYPELKLTEFGLTIKDGYVICNMSGNQTDPEKPSDWIFASARGQLQYDADTNMYYVTQIKGSLPSYYSYTLFVFSWSEENGLIMERSGQYNEDGSENYILNNVNLPLIKLPLEEFEGSYTGQLDDENETHARLQSVTMDIIDGQLHLEVTQYGVDYAEDIDLWQNGRGRYMEKDGRMAYRLYFATPPRGTYINAYLYLFEDDGTVLLEWSAIEPGSLRPVENLIMKRNGDGPSEPQEYDATIMGSGLSNTGEYMVTINGNVTGFFAEGENRMSITDIGAQNLAIMTFNMTNGAYRMMDQGSVEGLVVTVTNGEITDIAVTGRAQTSPGNFDRYTVNCAAM